MLGDRSDLTNAQGGTLRIERLIAGNNNPPFNEEDRRILFTNSSYFIEGWLEDWMDGYFRPVKPQPIMNGETIKYFNSYSYPFMNKRNLYDGVDPGFKSAPTSVDSIKAFLDCTWGCGIDWAYMSESSVKHIWLMNENLAYTNDTLLGASMGGFPLGDLYHWFPEEYNEWKFQKSEEDIKIARWLEDGIAEENVLPPAPLSLTAHPLVDMVKLQWEPIPKMGFRQYNIYGGSSPEPTTLVDTVSGVITSTAKVIGGLDSDSTYYFRVTAVNTLGIESEFSNQVNAKPLSEDDKQIVNVASDYPGSEGSLNKAVKEATDAGTLSITIFMLEAGGYYVLTDSIYIPPNEHLTIIAPEPGETRESAPPQILCATTFSDNPYTKFMFLCHGDITFKNLWLLYVNTDGWQQQSSLRIAHSPEITGIQKGTFENVVFDYSGIPADGAGAISLTTKRFNGIFRNCYWRNCTDAHFTYYGRAVSFPFQSTGMHIDSLSFENCTFANIGYVYSQELDNYADYVSFNHCTFLNTVRYTLESGWWHKLAVTNSVFVNAFMIGHLPAYYGEPNGGTIRIDSLSSLDYEFPFTEQERHILFTNSSYGIEKWLQDYMWNNPGSIDRRTYGEIDRIPFPQPMMNLYNPAFPDFIYPPTNLDSLKDFLYYKWWGGNDLQWAWKYRNSINGVWPLEENLAYTNSTLLTAGMGGFPLGDLYRWSPEKYEEWELQNEAEHERINLWLETGKDPGIVDVDENPVNQIPAEYKLYQNYPNPFNPVTRIEYSLPAESYVELIIYDILGNEVAVLFDGVLKPGKHSVNFNGSSQASGIYLYRINAGIFTDTKKLLLLK
jgi:hypothetical protein